MKQQFNIPIFRGKRIDNGEYVIGDYLNDNPDYKSGIYVIKKSPMCIETGHQDWYTDIYEIDINTLSIHFPTMKAKDSNRLLPNGEKDLRIFASLSEDGRGGDILEDSGEHYRAIFKNSCFVVCNDKVNKLCFESVVIKGLKNERS